MKLDAKRVREWQAAKGRQLLPIVYLRGFAASEGEIDDTTADPFNGFNIGSVLLRTGWTGNSARHVFESPVLRLTQPPFNYRLAFSDGVRGLSPEAKAELIDWKEFLSGQAEVLGSRPQAIIAIYRYYDINSHIVGEGKRFGMETFGWGLGRLILDLLDTTGADGVYVVAHSMGGLVARTFLQNEDVLERSHPTLGSSCDAVQSLIDVGRVRSIDPPDWQRARSSVKRFFTYGTPHNGITGQGGLGNALVGAIGAITNFGLDNFGREEIERYLSTPKANSLNGKFPVERTFCLIGTGSMDYPVASGFSRRLVGQRSDGLVEVDNAYVSGPDPDPTMGGQSVLAARAYVRRAHSGPYGMVNSEEGFGNLSRFLFGDVRIDGNLQVYELGLPHKLAPHKDDPDFAVNASYTFETFLRVRGESWAMTERLAQDGAAAFRRYDELLGKANPPKGMMLSQKQRDEKDWNRTVELFTAFLDTQLRTDPNRVETIEGQPKKGTMGFAMRLRVAVPDYEVNGRLWRVDHYEGSALLDKDYVFLAFQEEDGRWGLAWGPNRPDSGGADIKIIDPPEDDATAEQRGIAFSRVIPGKALQFWVPIENDGAPEFRAWLRLTARRRDDLGAGQS